MHHLLFTISYLPFAFPIHHSLFTICYFLFAICLSHSPFTIYHSLFAIRHFPFTILSMPPSELWRFLPVGYLLTILIETPILVIGLSKRHALRRRILAGIWLTACTYPIVILVLPLFFVSRFKFLFVAETFAPVAECLLFWLAFWGADDVRSTSRDFAAIVVANLASFGVGEILNSVRWFGLF